MSVLEPEGDGTPDKRGKFFIRSKKILPRTRCANDDIS